MRVSSPAITQEAAVAPVAREQAFQTMVRPFLKTHCLECHSGQEPEGELALDVFEKAAAVTTTGRKVWLKVRGKLLARAMPPEDEPQPAAKDIGPITNWIDEAMAHFDCSGPADPGHETIHRLNRAEYRNTIRDLLGVDFALGDDFPVDDVGYGFDNMGDVLTLPPILMEKYLASAEQIAAKAIMTDPARQAPAQRFPPDQLTVTGQGTTVRGGARLLLSRGNLAIQYTFPRRGEYIVRAKAFGQQAGDEPVKMVMRIGKLAEKVVEVKVSGDRPAVYEYRAEVKAGQRPVTVAFVNDYYNANDPDPNNRDRNLGVHYIEVACPIPQTIQDYPDPHRRIFFVLPGDKLPAADAARQILQRL